MCGRVGRGGEGGMVVGKAHRCPFLACSPHNPSFFITFIGLGEMPLYLRLPGISGQKYCCVVFNLP